MVSFLLIDFWKPIYRQYYHGNNLKTETHIHVPHNPSSLRTSRVLSAASQRLSVCWRRVQRVVITREHHQTPKDVCVCWIFRSAIPRPSANPRETITNANGLKSCRTTTTRQCPPFWHGSSVWYMVLAIRVNKCPAGCHSLEPWTSCWLQIAWYRLRFDRKEQIWGLTCSHVPRW